MADLDPKKVVVIDSDSDTLEPLERSLVEHGLRPILLRRGDRALKMVKDEKPGAIILELSLPDVDGRRVIKELKDDWDAKKVPIVVFSNYPNRLDYSTRGKVEAVLGKPVAWEEVVHQVRQAIERAKSSN